MRNYSNWTPCSQRVPGMFMTLLLILSSSKGPPSHTEIADSKMGTEAIEILF